MGTWRMRGDGPPVYAYEAMRGTPPVGTLRLGQELSPGGLPHAHPHSHDFLVLTYFKRDGSMWLGDQECRVEAGDAHVIAPGEVVAVGDASGLEEAEGWAVFFPPEVLGPQTPRAFVSWPAHPLLFPFVRGAAGGTGRLKVPREPALVIRALFGLGPRA